MKSLVKLDQGSPMEITASFEALAQQVAKAVAGMSPKEAFSKLEAELLRSGSYIRGSMLYTCYMVALQRDIWDGMGLDEQHQIASSFYEYIADKLGIVQEVTTIDNYINTAKTWLLEDTRVEAPQKVFLWDVADGQASLVVDEDDNSYDVPVSVWDVQYSKLLAANGRAGRDVLEEDDWGMLFNPTVSQGAMTNAWRGPHTPPNKVPGLNFLQVGDFIAISDGTDIVEIAELSVFEIEHNPLAKQGWERMRKALRIINEEDDF